MFLSRISKELVLLFLFVPMVSAWTAKWINLGLDIGSSIDPPRSGHVAFGLDDKIYVFGGYAEDRDTSERYPTNDLWCFGEEKKWTLVKPASKSQPQPRLASIALSCQLDKDTTVGLVLGGWDSQQAGTGGEILKDIQAFSSTGEDGGSWKELPVDLQEPTSRLCALPLINESTSLSSKIFIHNHRCIDHVMLLDLETSKLTKQPVSGTCPSARGLHCCVQLPGTSKIVLFGGAAQIGTMSNEVFVLDTETWVWEDCGCGESEKASDGVPSPRASPCFVALDDKSCILFGGASRSDEGGLHGCSDTWLLELEESETNDGSSAKTTAKWTQLGEDKSAQESAQAPPGRNAATLIPFLSTPDFDEDDKEDSQFFLLSGGWYPFRTTYGDNFVLKVTKK